MNLTLNLQKLENGMVFKYTTDKGDIAITYKFSIIEC
ncbi:hypothetical protein TthWC1_0431 [Thermoanaerobacter thermohydrosulfuricus WC1]|uniref:Uncharacterized protein n=1 Tax=Thermoanaerobacter thermohydrosulfuricus WC1 TaxID=1198630 RepID=M8DIP0_THETY|nr:hypothetical protein TthWC1_0431 [Thermoanaerobacter thermohydrosulfuricus WC1]